MNGKHVFDAMPQTLVHGAEGSASKIAEAVETASARVASVGDAKSVKNGRQLQLAAWLGLVQRID